MSTIDADALQALIAGGENIQVELKGADARPHDLAGHLCGLANTVGGWVVMGVDDTTLTPVGVRDVKHTKDNLIQASRMCQPPLVFAPPEPQVVLVEGRKLIVVYIPRTSGILYQARGVFWSRKGSQTVPLTAQEITALLLVHVYE